MAPQAAGAPRALGASFFVFGYVLSVVQGVGSRAWGLVRGFMSFLDVESIEELDPHRRCHSMSHHSRDMRVSLRLPAHLSIAPRQSLCLKP